MTDTNECPQHVKDALKAIGMDDAQVEVCVKLTEAVHNFALDNIAVGSDMISAAELMVASVALNMAAKTLEMDAVALAAGDKG